MRKTLLLGIRSSHRRCFIDKAVLKILQYSQENTCVEVCNFIKKRPQHMCFPVNIAKFLRVPNLRKHLQTAASNEFLSPLLF